MKQKKTKETFSIDTDIRLPFEAKGEALELKKQIRSQLKSFKQSGLHNLEARLITADKGFFDVENVLLYNVGVGRFAELDLDSVCFSIDTMETSSNHKKYKYVYSIHHLEPIKSDRILNNLLMKFQFDMSELTTSLKAHDYWLGFKRANIINFNQKDFDEFGLFIELHSNQQLKNLVSLIKPMLDGIISALHYQNNVSEEVYAYLTSNLNISFEEASVYFKKNADSLLGKRRVVSKYRNGIKWNPEDERCKEVYIVKKRNGNEGSLIRGLIYKAL